MNFKAEIENILETHRSYNDQLTDINNQLQQLEKDGLNWGRAHYRDGRYLKITQPVKDGERKVDYVGCKPDKVKKTLEDIERAKRFKQLSLEKAEIDSSLRTMLNKLRNVTSPW